MKNLDEIKFAENKRHQAGMTVPEGFFEQFQQQLENKIDVLEVVKPAPVVEMPKRNMPLNFRWAIAACCTLVVGIGAYWLFQGTEAALPAAETTEVAALQNEAETEMEEMIIRSVNDFELYEYYCEL